MLSKRWLINYFLFILIIVFTWIGYKFPIREDQKINHKAITTLQPDLVERIRVETADGSIQLEQKQNRWFITQPFLWFADNIAAERLTTLASISAHSKLPKSQIDLSTLGLSIPRAVVTLNQQSIAFGATNQIGNRRYVMNDKTVFLVDDVHYPFIQQGFPALVDKRLLPAGSGLQSLRFGEFNLVQQAGVWQSEKKSATQQAVDRLISHWQNEPAAQIKVYDPSRTPIQKIVATFDSGENTEFYLLAIKPEIIIARPDLELQYYFPEKLYYDLLSLDQAAAQ
jgi:hypothetical protein